MFRHRHLRSCKMAVASAQFVSSSTGQLRKWATQAPALWFEHVRTFHFRAARNQTSRASTATWWRPLALAILLVGTESPSLAASLSLPRPDGKYSVGVVRGEFDYPKRRIDPTNPTERIRRIPAVIWYPTALRGSAAYLPAAAETTAAAISRSLGLNPEEVEAFSTTRLPEATGAPPTAGRFPVIIFNHGFGSYPEQNSALVLRLVSHGYIIVSIAHPGDSSDLRLANGKIVPFQAPAKGDMPPEIVMQFLFTRGGLAERRALMGRYRDAFVHSRLGRSSDEWRDDIIAVARSIASKNVPAALRRSMSGADGAELGFAGMSFGGASAAVACKQVPQCHAVVNLDGQNWDPGLVDRPLRRPLLLMLSDWPRYTLFPDLEQEFQMRDPAFSGNDLSYESWATAGLDRDIIRLRLSGVRHMGFTDLVTLQDDPQRESRVGAISGEGALGATGDVVLAFLDTYLKHGPKRAINQAIADHSELSRHDPAQVRSWADHMRAKT